MPGDEAAGSGDAALCVRVWKFIVWSTEFCSRLRCQKHLLLLWGETPAQNPLLQQAYYAPGTYLDVLTPHSCCLCFFRGINSPEVSWVCLPHGRGQPGYRGRGPSAWNWGLRVFEVGNLGRLQAGTEPERGILGAGISCPGPFLACRLREPLTLELGPQGNIEEVSVSSCEEWACRQPGPECMCV